MADGKTHRRIGTALGAAQSIVRSSGQPPFYRFVEAVGAAAGGHVGAELPDVLEPAVHSWHRDVCHSATAGGTIAKASYVLVGELEQRCRAKANALAKQRSSAIDLQWWERF